VLGVGVIGAGAISRCHADGYASAGSRARLVAVADLDLARARKLGRSFRFDAAVADYRELLARPEIDLVSVCTPPATHAEITLEALNAGKHVLCEKPITTDVRDAVAVGNAALGSPGLRVSCVFQYREDPALRRARWLIGEGLIGEVASARVSAHARRTAAYYSEARGSWHSDGGGALMVQGIHLLDAMVWLLGGVDSVSATMGTLMHDIEAEDAISGWARLSRGGLATIDCSTCAHRDRYEMDIQGEHGALHLRYLPGWGHAWQLAIDLGRHRHPRRVAREARRRYPSRSALRAADFGRVAAARATGSGRRPRHSGHALHIRRFLDAVEYGLGAPVPPVDAQRSVELVAGFYRSATEGHPVTLALS
jgi:UDP-N-acetyl-2-amino-2-deoxyglucuronate dehydrogenase